jgi:AraC family transcriptional regulator of adaptative response/methylated-DNA-[protein]-cysteine methyltransferase
MDLTSRPLPSQEEMYEAFMHPKDSDDNSFFVAVISSGVFNTSNCLSKKPLRENIEFFSSTKEALDWGYRPCLSCQPMLANTDAPDKYKELIAEVDHDTDFIIEDEDLVKMDIDRKLLKAWFQKNHGISFQAYLRYLRINHLFGNIRVDKHPKIHRAYHIGEIVHGVEEGDSTETIVNKNIIYINRIATPIGPVIVGATDEGICLLEFSDRKILESQLKNIESYFEAVLTPGESEHFTLLAKELDEYFNGERKTFTVPLATAGTPFQESVWESLIEIPYGQTRSYKEQSIVLKNPKAIRAIAHANGENRIAILIPCHRIIGSDGKLVGYGGGLWRKQFLLELENPNQISLDF